MQITTPNDDGLILLTGATGYVGGRLLRDFEGRGLRLRCLARRPEALQARVAKDTEVVQGDLLDAASLRRAMEGVAVAYYLVHALGETRGFEEKELEGARNFATAARASGVQRIIYLGGLGPDGEELSPHLRTRHDVGRILRESGVLTIEFRASIIIGSGSLSYELVRALVRKLPVMVVPRWVTVPAQPIGITDVIRYLRRARTIDLPESTVFEIGGADRMSYRDVFLEYARQRGVRRWIIPVPVLTPRVSSYWLHLVTPIHARIGRRLAESAIHEMVVNDTRALEVFDFRPMSTREAIALALRKEDRDYAQTHWSDALSSYGPVRNYGGVKFGSRLVDHRELGTSAAPETLFAAVEAIGGTRGWYYGHWLWQLRGLLDRLVGGVGLRRGRRDPLHLRAGDVVDFWRVEVVEPINAEGYGRLRLQAEMKLPGRAWLEFEVKPAPDGGAKLFQTASFDPKGVLGPLYWYALWPLHEFVFKGMARNLCRWAEAHPAPDSQREAA